MTGEVLRLVETLRDELAVADDYVSGVIALSAGVLGGVDAGGDGGSQRSQGALRSAFSSLRHRVNSIAARSTAKGFAAAYGPTQLGKGAREVRSAIATIDRLRAAGSATELVSALDRLCLDSVAQSLASAEQVIAGHSTIRRAAGIVDQARVRLILDR